MGISKSKPKMSHGRILTEGDLDLKCMCGSSQRWAWWKIWLGPPYFGLKGCRSERCPRYWKHA